MFAQFLIFHIASGQSFFSGVACLIVAICLSAYKKQRGVRVARNVLFLLGTTLVAASATPSPPWFYLLLLMAMLLWLAIEAFGGRIPARFVLGVRIAVIALWLSAALVEFPHHLTPTIPRLGRPTLEILGDSLTAGMGESKAGTWPGILAAGHGIIVRDHSVRGADVASALRQAASIAPDARLVLLEIGGNDILGSTTPDQFEAGLAKLLAAVSRPGRVVVMFELPLPPTYNAFGLIQRRQARRSGTLLIPKRVLLGILLRPGATLDTIHLSRDGHRIMADAVWNVFRDAYGDEK